MKKILKLSLLVGMVATTFVAYSTYSANKEATSGAEDRAYCVSVMQKIVDPVLDLAEKKELEAKFPRRQWEIDNKRCDLRTTVLQAVARSISGMSPWLSLGADDTEEGKLRAEYIEKARNAIISITDPQSPDYQFSKERSTYERIVHNAYIAYPLLVATEQLWEPLTQEQKDNVIAALITHRPYKPFDRNWVLFSSVIEAAVWKFTGECDMEKLEYGVKRFRDDWYCGDGVYGDGPHFNWDYYNSYVIQPLLMVIIDVCEEKNHEFKDFKAIQTGRAMRYAEIQERLISPDGTYPIIGRSNNYRIASFQHLGYMAFKNLLPSSMKPGSTRAAMTAITHNTMDAPGTFDENGFLNPGVAGLQLESRDIYTVTGALYMVSMGLTQLGVPADAPFWTEPASKWFQQRVWSGEEIPHQNEYYDANRKSWFNIEG